MCNRLMLTLAFLTASLHAMPGEFPKGRFIGFMAPHGGSEKIATTLDLFIVQDSDEYQKLSGIVRVSLGGHFSGEYATYVYEDIKYSWSAGELHLNLDHHEILIEEVRYHANRFMGTVALVSTATKADLQLIHESELGDQIPGDLIFPDKPMVSTLSGEYRGTCSGKTTVLQIEASKWKMREEESRNFLNGYEIMGRIASKESNLCRSGDAFCIRSNLNNGVYDLFNRRLLLHGHPSTLECQVSNRGNDLECGECSFSKQRDLLSQRQVNKPINQDKSFTVQTDEEPLPEIPVESDLDGEFSGFLTYENRGIRQPLRMRVHAYGYSDRPHRPELIHISTTAWLSFGSEGKRVSIDFRNRQFLTTQPYFMLEGNHGWKFQVSKWTRTSVQGTAYSEQFGRVGTFHVRRSNSTSNEGTFPNLGGRFKSTQWNLFLQFLGETGDEEVEAIFPLTIRGNLQLRGLTSRLYIDDFSFDAFTGRMATKLSDGRFVYLTQNVDDRLEIMIPSISEWGAVLKSYDESTLTMRR